MKKIFCYFIIIFILTGCNNQKFTTFKEININNIIMYEYIDNNPIKIGIYQGNKKITSYNTTVDNFKELGVFNIYYTNKDILDNYNIKYNYLKYYNEYKDIKKYKTGFYISYEAEGKIIEKLILDPTSTHAMAPYMYVYLYDDVNQIPGAFYSHLEEKDMKENTIISSIKLFFPHKGTSITSPITLTVFTYDGKDDFKDNLYYRGTSSYTIKINTKK